jgi:hypothetical protein
MQMAAEKLEDFLAQKMGRAQNVDAESEVATYEL